MYCKKCKIHYPNGGNFCSKCGNPLEEEINVYGEAFYNGEEQAFESIYNCSYKWVCKYVYNKIPGRDVEDCVQNIYIKPILFTAQP